MEKPAMKTTIASCLLSLVFVTWGLSVLMNSLIG